MKLAHKKDLEGRVDSQMLLGDRLLVIATRDDWAQVTVPDQPSPLDQRGYPGWMPLAQLTFDQPVSSQREATVVRPTTWFLDGAGRRVMETSMGTRLPVRDTTPDAVVVATPDGASLRV